MTSVRGPLPSALATAAYRAALALDAKTSDGAEELLSEVSQHLERITVAVLSQELLTKSALEMALLPILQGTWEEARARHFCDVCWAAAAKAALRSPAPAAPPTEAAQKAMAAMAEHHANELIKEELSSSAPKRKAKGRPGPKAKPPTPPPPEAEAESDSSSELKVRDQSNSFSVFQDVKDDSPMNALSATGRKATVRDRCKWTVKSYKDGLETTWDVLETDGHLNSMRIVGKESVSNDTSCAQRTQRAGPSEGRAKSGHSTLSYSETAEEEHSMMRTVSSGTAQRLFEELEEERRWEMNLEGLEEGLCDEVSIGELEMDDAAQAPEVWDGAWQEESSFYSAYPPASPPSLPSMPLPPGAVPRRAPGCVERTPSAPSRLEQSCPPSPLFPRDLLGAPGGLPRRRVNSHDYNFSLARQMSLESSITSDSAGGGRSMTQTPPGLFPSTPECDPSPSTGFMLPPLHNLPASIAESPPGALMTPQVVYIPVLLPHRCSHCGHDCDGRGPLAAPLAAPEMSASTFPRPEACGDLELSVEERAWIYLRASQASLVDRKNLAGFLSSPKPHCKELLKAYTRLWESEWRMEWRNTLEIPEESAASSPGSRQSSRSGSQGPTTTTPSDVSRRTRSQSRRRMSRTASGLRSKKNIRDWILGRLGGVSSTADDKSNGNLFVSAMRSFFANAIRMAKLEADPVQRVIEAFAEALVADSAFLSCFQASMLPEAERQTYRTPDEVLFGLAYTTLMLNTDMHNKQVAQKMWDNKKFVGAGKGCGVTGGLMAQIYKNIQGEEI
ncbi:unnamed protein product [Cladocopium goreaui]|uniref:SEC7 domain-containing protein n=1 Tax=Cladocopium goreaui TaxID=2562237 RepID=A0A9P1GHX7_9DINO|nr:unnamed protein product [Cladocopium goreaui]